jgi:hypothetical protein
MLLRRNGEYHHRDVLGNKGVITDGSGNVLSSNEGEGVGLEYDAFGVSMFTSGSAQTPYRPSKKVLDVEGLEFGSGPPVACPLYANRALALSEECRGGPRKKPKPKPPRKPHPPKKPAPPPSLGQCLDHCYNEFKNEIQKCFDQLTHCLKTEPAWFWGECYAIFSGCIPPGYINCVAQCYQDYPPPTPIPPGRMA